MEERKGGRVDCKKGGKAAGYEGPAAIFKALSDANRLAIVTMLREEGEICACRLLERLDVTQPTLSYHMKSLCACGLVSCRKDGRWMHYSLDDEALEAALRVLSDRP